MLKIKYGAFQRTQAHRDYRNYRECLLEPNLSKPRKSNFNVLKERLSKPRYGNFMITPSKAKNVFVPQDADANQRSKAYQRHIDDDDEDDDDDADVTICIVVICIICDDR